MSSQSLMISAVGFLSAYLFFLLLMKHRTRSSFALTRITLTSFVVFAFLTLFVVYWRFVIDEAVWASIALLAGTFVGRFLAVEASQKRIAEEGLGNYFEHYLHIHIKSLHKVEWYSLVNVHTIIVALVLINMLGLNELIFESPEWTRFSIVFANFLVGTCIPYMIHLWTLKAPHAKAHVK
jgi:hypothetical protein